jgi:hypothetical protein
LKKKMAAVEETVKISQGFYRMEGTYYIIWKWWYLNPGEADITWFHSSSLPCYRVAVCIQTVNIYLKTINNAKNIGKTRPKQIIIIYRR